MLLASFSGVMVGMFFVALWASTSPDLQQQPGPLLAAAFLFVGGAAVGFFAALTLAVLMTGAMQPE